MYYIYSTDYNKSILLNPGSTVNLNSMGGPSTNITSEIYEGNKVKISIDNTSSVGSYGNLYVYQYHKSPTFPTPDWNAQEGEAGYIENKPFYTEGDIRQIDVNGEYFILIGEFNIGDRIDVSWDLDYYDTDEVFHGSASFVIQEGGEEPTQYYEGDNFYIRGGKSFEMYAYDAGNPLYGKVTVMVNGEIKTLEEKYIPNTVIKTTPQTLTNTDKNQALANLGIADLLEALKPVELVGDSEFPKGDNVSQEDLDNIGLTRSVIDNILNGITTKITRDGALFNVTSVYKWNNTFKFSLIFTEDPQIIETETGEIISTFFSATSYNVRYNGTVYKCKSSGF